MKTRLEASSGIPYFISLPRQIERYAETINHHQGYAMRALNGRRRLFGSSESIGFIYWLVDWWCSFTLKQLVDIYHTSCLAFNNNIFDHDIRFPRLHHTSTTMEGKRNLVLRIKMNNFVKIVLVPRAWRWWRMCGIELNLVVFHRLDILIAMDRHRVRDSFCAPGTRQKFPRMICSLWDTWNIFGTYKVLNMVTYISFI
jgi:hypothetical protein